MIKSIAKHLIKNAEKQIGVSLDYVHHIAKTDISLLTGYNKIFAFLNPNKKNPALAYHTARLRGAIAADCGTCVEAEINLAKKAKLELETIKQVLVQDYENLPKEIAAIAKLADAILSEKSDNQEAREIIKEKFGDAGLIEISFAINGGALLPGIKKTLGYGTTCDLNIIAQLQKEKAPQ